MNSHLNIFKTYTNVERTHQLENDLTRVLAITLQEDALFLHEVLKEIMLGTDQYNLLFESSESESNVSIEIQQNSSRIKRLNCGDTRCIHNNTMIEYVSAFPSPNPRHKSHQNLNNIKSCQTT